MNQSEFNDIKCHKASLKVSSVFKILLCFITFVSVLYFILIKRDIMSALFLLNIISNYRVMLAFLTDWHEEIIFKDNIINNNSHGISSNRDICDNDYKNNNNNNNNSTKDVSPNSNISNFVSSSNIDSQPYTYLNDVYADKINYNYENYDTNFAWWSEF